jgi:shikimate dehydrogenase
LGHPISHSLSPTMHRAAYGYLGLDWTYEAIDVDQDDLASFVDACDATWRGLSLTMPLKVSALAVATEVEPLARTLKSVNTLVFDGEDRLGYNTDVIGLLRVIDTALSADPKPTSVTLLGSGATARSALGALATSAASLGIKTVTVCARSEPAVDSIMTLGSELDLEVKAGQWPPAALGVEGTGERQLVVNTLPWPAASELATTVVGPQSPGSSLLIDVLYHPWPSPLARLWTSSGGAVIGGVEMLVMQGVAQVELMTGLAVPPEVLRDAAMGELDRRNIAQAEQ